MLKNNLTNLRLFFTAGFSFSLSCSMFPTKLRVLCQQLGMFQLKLLFSLSSLLILISQKLLLFFICSIVFLKEDYPKMRTVSLSYYLLHFHTNSLHLINHQSHLVFSFSCTSIYSLISL